MFLGNVSSRRMYDRGLVVGGSAPIWREEEPAPKFYKDRDKRHQVPTAVDRETVYDFDAWTRAHYVKAKDRSYAAKVRNEFRSNRRNNMYQRLQTDRYFFLLLVAILGGFGLFELVFGEKYDKVKQPTNS